MGQSWKEKSIEKKDHRHGKNVLDENPNRKQKKKKQKKPYKIEQLFIGDRVKYETEGWGIYSYPEQGWHRGFLGHFTSYDAAKSSLDSQRKKGWKRENYIYRIVDTRNSSILFTEENQSSSGPISHGS